MDADEARERARYIRDFIPEQLDDERSIEEFLEQRFTESTMSKAARDILADTIPEEGGGAKTFDPWAPHGEVAFNENADRWQDRDTGRFVPSPFRFQDEL